MSGAPSLRWLTGDAAKAACVLWASGQFSTFDIAVLLQVPENAVDRTLRLARDTARQKERS